MWLFVGGLILQLFSSECMCARVHAEPILLNPVPHWIPVSSLSTATSESCLSLCSRQLVLAQEVAGGLGLPPIRPSDWSASCSRNQPPSYRRLLWMDSERRSTQGCDVSGLFFKRGHMREWICMFFFPVAATLKSFFFSFSFPSHPGSSRPSAAP